MKIPALTGQRVTITAIKFGEPVGQYTTLSRQQLQWEETTIECPICSGHTLRLIISPRTMGRIVRASKTGPPFAAIQQPVPDSHAVLQCPTCKTCFTFPRARLTFQPEAP